MRPSQTAKPSTGLNKMKDLQTRLAQLREQETRGVIGLMSGTSADGITAAYTEITGTGETAEIKLVCYETYPFKASIQERVFRLFKPRYSSVQDVCEMNTVLGEAFGDAANRLTAEHRLSPDLIGSHGQTIWHQPDQGATLQIGEPAVISQKTGLPVIADFRKADMAVGGEGAPLTPYLDFVLHRDPSERRVLQNIGGIGNLTYLGGGDVVAFDTGPGNMVIDATVKQLYGYTHDMDGVIAEKGTVNQTLLAELLSHPYYKKKPPKTTGREVFGEHYAEQVITRGKELGLTEEDIVATATRLTIETIHNAYNTLPGIDAVYISGGGARNPVIINGLREILDTPVQDYSVLGFSSEAKESVLMALLANEYVMDTPSNLPQATGALKKVVLGYASWV